MGSWFTRVAVRSERSGQGTGTGTQGGWSFKLSAGADWVGLVDQRESPHFILFFWERGRVGNNFGEPCDHDQRTCPYHGHSINWSSIINRPWMGSVLVIVVVLVVVVVVVVKSIFIHSLIILPGRAAFLWSYSWGTLLLEAKRWQRKERNKGRNDARESYIPRNRDRNRDPFDRLTGKLIETEEGIRKEKNKEERPTPWEKKVQEWELFFLKFFWLDGERGAYAYSADFFCEYELRMVNGE